MSKIIYNNTASPVPVTDAGVTVPASGSYTLDPQEYDRWASSSDIVTLVGDETLKVNDGSTDLSISDGIDLIKGIFPKHIAIRGDTDSTLIGNVGDRLKVDAQFTNPINLPMASIDWIQYFILLGRTFWYTTHLSLGDNDTKNYVFVTPATGTRYPHLTYSISSAVETDVDIYEGPTLVQGSTLTVFNRDRNSAIANTTLLKNVTSVSGVGTQIENTKIGASLGKGNNDVENSSNVNEIILKGNTHYLFRIVSYSNNNVVLVKFNWYEYDASVNN